MHSQVFGKFGQGHGLGFGRTGQREKRVQFAIKIFKVRSRQTVEALAQLCPADDFVNRVEQWQRQDRQSDLGEQAQFFGNDIAASSQGVDLEMVAVSLRENRQIVIRDAEELAEKAGNLITAPGLRQYY